jgi:hypothetical protein
VAVFEELTVMDAVERGEALIVADTEAVRERVSVRELVEEPVLSGVGVGVAGGPLTTQECVTAVQVA